MIFLGGVDVVGLLSTWKGEVESKAKEISWG